MRQDKLTTKLQEALSDAQSVAVGNDNQYIEPVHLLTALLAQDDGGTRSLLQRAGVNIGGLTPGIDNNNYYPKTRTFTLGLTASF